MQIWILTKNLNSPCPRVTATSTRTTRIKSLQKSTYRTNNRTQEVDASISSMSRTTETMAPDPTQKETDSGSLSLKDDEVDDASRPGFEKAWMERYNELREYYETTGSCSVPSDYSPNRKLGNWVRTQRGKLKLYVEGEASSAALTPKQVELLEQINFQWNDKCDWMQRYKELEEYFNYHGHSSVTSNWKENPSLGRWVERQRTNYRLWKEGKPSNMTEERFKLLEELNFRWKARDEWLERYQDLATYFQTYGHSAVTLKNSTNPQEERLAKWADTRMFMTDYKRSLKLAIPDLTNVFVYFRTTAVPVVQTGKDFSHD